jgi:hypothetical protein
VALGVEMLLYFLDVLLPRLFFVFIFLLLLMVGMLVARPLLSSHGERGILFGRVLATIRSHNWLLIVDLGGVGVKLPKR